ncbi:MAG: DUF4276 family protein [Firmicutes bacterium]|nr:DUF4276 family protein [Bacillota bacterium]
MRNIALFVEDYGHEQFLVPLLERIAHEHDTPVNVFPRSVRGGYGKVITEFSNFLKDLSVARVQLPDLILVATDANCRGYAERKRQIQAVIKPDYNHLIVCAIPDPHIERWLLIDAAAFKAVLGKGCNAPDQKCAKDRYKQLLFEAIRNVGITPPLGGLEYARDIAGNMDLQKASRIDDSFNRLVADLRSKFKEWGR